MKRGRGRAVQNRERERRASGGGKRRKEEEKEMGSVREREWSTG